MLIRRCLPYVLAAVAAAGTALAQTPYERSGAAIVIYIDAASLPNIHPFDELQAGRRIALGEEETMELGYFDSCVMEAITGGAVTIGARESRVEGGRIQRETVDCANMRFQHGVAQLQFAAAAVFEKAGASSDGGSGAVTGGDEIASWSGGGPAVPDQLDVLIGPLFVDLDGRHRIAVLPVSGVAGVATPEAAAGARAYLISRLRAETPHVLIADEQVGGRALTPGEALDDRLSRRLRAAGAEVAVLCALDVQGGETVLGCQAQMVDEDIVVGHGAVVLYAGAEAEEGVSAIVE